MQRQHHIASYMLQSQLCCWFWETVQVKDEGALVINAPLHDVNLGGFLTTRNPLLQYDLGSGRISFRCHLQKAGRSILCINHF